jgi:hypothetical protein
MEPKDKHNIFDLMNETEFLQCNIYSFFYILIVNIGSVYVAAANNGDTQKSKKIL